MIRAAQDITLFFPVFSNSVSLFLTHFPLISAISAYLPPSFPISFSKYIWESDNTAYQIL